MRKLMASTAAALLVGGLGAGGALAATGHAGSHGDISSRDRVSHVGDRGHSRSSERSQSRTDRASRDRETSARSH